MINLESIYTDELILPTDHFVGILFFSEYPTTQVYSDDNGTPIIKEWVDCSDDGLTDRFFYYKSSVINFKRFIDGVIPHRELILNAIDGLAYFQDESNSEVFNNNILSINHLPDEYMPSSDFYFNHIDGVDLELIINHFELTTIEDDHSVFNKVKELAKQKNYETFNLHFALGRGIGYGTINTGIIGKTLVSFDKFYKDAALDYIFGSNRGAAKKDKIKQISPEISTEIYGNIAASYSVLLRPANSQFRVFDDATQAEIIAKNIFGLLSNSINIDKLKEEYSLHSEYTFNSYKNFLKKIYELDITLELNWFNPVNTQEYRESLDITSSNTIIDNIKNLNIESEEKFSKMGKFRAINCDTGHFNFTSNSDEQFSGYFDKLLEKGSEQISFLQVYKVSIHRKITKEAGKAEATVVDFIIAFYLEQE